MISHTELEILLKLFLAALIGGLVGWEREVWHRPAGLRTHILVCVGAAIFAMIGGYGFANSPDAASRVIANIVVGIGFLGSGVLIKDEHRVHGMTTAAGIWIVAALGATVAVGLYFLSIVGAILIFVVLHWLLRLERQAVPPPDAETRP